MRLAVFVHDQRKAVDRKRGLACGDPVDNRLELAYVPPDSAARGRHDSFIASNEMLFTPNFLLAPRALSEMNW